MRKGEAKLYARSIRPEDERWRRCTPADGGSTAAANREKKTDGSAAEALYGQGEASGRASHAEGRASRDEKWRGGSEMVHGDVEQASCCWWSL